MTRENAVAELLQRYGFKPDAFRGRDLAQLVVAMAHRYGEPGFEIPADKQSLAHQRDAIRLRLMDEMVRPLSKVRNAETVAKEARNRADAYKRRTKGRALTPVDLDKWDVTKVPETESESDVAWPTTDAEASEAREESLRLAMVAKEARKSYNRTGAPRTQKEAALIVAARLSTLARNAGKSAATAYAEHFDPMGRRTDREASLTSAASAAAAVYTVALGVDAGDFMRAAISSHLRDIDAHYAGKDGLGAILTTASRADRVGEIADRFREVLNRQLPSDGLDVIYARWNSAISKGRAHSMPAAKDSVDIRNIALQLAEAKRLAEELAAIAKLD